MRPAHFLESLTDTYCPGRFAIKTRAIPRNLGRSSRKQWEDGQAEAIVKYCADVHEQSRLSLVGAFEMLVRESKGDNVAEGLGDRIFADIRNACYPYIFIAAADVRRALKFQKRDSSPLVLAPRDHMSTIAEPEVLREYYFEQCRNLLAHGYLLEAGLSIVPMPVTYALERSAIEQAGASGTILDALESFFPVPTLSEVEDSVVDGWYQRREESILVDREYTLLNSVFWEAYKEYLRSGKWRIEPASRVRDLPDALVRAKLQACRSKVVETQRVSAQEQRVTEHDETLTSVVAPRDGIAPPLPPTADHRPKVVRYSYQIPKPLSYFDAPRTHFSMSRLHYYTGTDAKYFQKSILAVNYPEYARRFVLRALVEIYLAGSEKDGKLVIASDPRSAHPGGLVLDHAQVVQLFPAKKEGGDNDGELRNSLDAVAKLVKDRTAAEDLEASAEYRKCLSKVAELLRSSDAQMPAYHYIPPHQARDAPRRPSAVDVAYRKRIFEAMDLPGITMINVGVGPSNAKTVTDHLAPLRPRCWILIGRCSGLRKEQHIGDYVFATSYVRRDGVLDKRVPLDAPIKTTRAVINAFDAATAYLSSCGEETAKEIDAEKGTIARVRSYFDANSDGRTPEQVEALFHALRQIVRLGTVISTSDRSWETAPTEELLRDFDANRAVALDMEGGVIAANGYRYRVHHGAFLCVSAKPLDGSVRIRQLQNRFYARQSSRHLEIAIGALRWLEYNFESALLLQYSRELRGDDDPPWD